MSSRQTVPSSNSYNDIFIIIMHEEPAKICQTVLEYFNMEKYEYIYHVINMLVLQKVHITGISHSGKSSRFGWGTMMKALYFGWHHQKDTGK